VSAPQFNEMTFFSKTIVDKILEPTNAENDQSWIVNQGWWDGIPSF